MVKYLRALSNPSEVIDFLKWRHRHTTHYLFQSLSNGRVRDAIWLLPSYLTSGRYFSNYLFRKSEDGFLTVDCGEFKIYIRPTDVGIGRELYFLGSHEPKTTTAYKRELRRIRKATSEPLTILEIGANIGYFALEALSQCPESKVYAIEALEQNCTIFEKNIERNGYTKQVTLTQGAVTTKTGKTEIYLSDSSNHASINPKNDSTRDTQKISCWRFEDYLNQHKISFSEINAVRMDIEGHEADLFNDGLNELLKSISQEFVLNIEIHPKYIDDTNLERMITTFESELQFVTGYQHEINGKPIKTIENLDQVQEDGLDWAELIFRVQDTT